MAFTIAYRRLSAKNETEYEKDGGVTVLLRYTLRLPEEVKALVEAAKQACLDGSLKITSAYGRTADQFNELRAWANNE